MIPLGFFAIAGRRTAETGTAPTNLTPPTITGGETDGQWASVVPGTWTGSPMLSYQWQVNSSGWTPIVGATGSTFNIPTPGEYRVIETATNVYGASSVTSPSIIAEASSGSYPMWSDSSSNGEIYDSGRMYRRGTGTAFANCFTNRDIVGRQYVEIEVTRVTTGIAGINITGQVSKPPYTADVYAYSSWAAPVATIAVPDQWSINARANYGMGAPYEMYRGQIVELPGVVPVAARLHLLIDSETRSVFVRYGSNWVDGQDPSVPGSTPVMLMGGTDPLCIGAVSNNLANTVRLILPEDHQGATPAGATNYMTLA